MLDTGFVPKVPSSAKSPIDKLSEKSESEDIPIKESDKANGTL